MNDQLTTLLRDLASQLGTTVDFLWGVLLVQARLTGYMSIIWAIFWTIPFLICAIVAYIGFKEGADDETSSFMTIAGTIVGIIMLAIVVMFITSAITAFANPEFWAINRILTQLAK